MKRKNGIKSFCQCRFYEGAHIVLINMNKSISIPKKIIITCTVDSEQVNFSELFRLVFIIITRIKTSISSEALLPFVA